MPLEISRDQWYSPWIQFIYHMQTKQPFCNVTHYAVLVRDVHGTADGDSRLNFVPDVRIQ